MDIITGYEMNLFWRKGLFGVVYAILLCFQHPLPKSRCASGCGVGFERFKDVLNHLVGLGLVEEFGDSNPPRSEQLYKTTISGINVLDIYERIPENLALGGERPVRARGRVVIGPFTGLKRRR